jgi:hypothetical protein
MGDQDPRTGSTSLGLNHNIRYRDRVYHLQTENGGAAQREIFTQLFLGGNIIASARRPSPSTEVGQIRKEMEAQHRAVAKALLAGQHDEIIGRFSQSGVYAPGVLANGTRGPELLVGGTPVANTPVIPASPPEPPSRLASPPAPPSAPRLAPAPAPPPVVRQSPKVELPLSGFSDDLIVRHLVTELDDEEA